MCAFVYMCDCVLVKAFECYNVYVYLLVRVLTFLRECVLCAFLVCVCVCVHILFQFVSVSWVGCVRVLL